MFARRLRREAAATARRKIYQKGGFKMKGKYEQPTVRIVGIAQRDLISTSVESTKDFNRDWLDSVGDTPGETV